MLPKFAINFQHHATVQGPTGNSLRGAFVTASGMLALWDAEHFAGIVSNETWESQLLHEEDIARHIDSGAFVPINICSYGSFECQVRVGDEAAPAELSPREAQYSVVVSQPYLFRSQGKAFLSGIEHVQGHPPPVIRGVNVPHNSYSVVIHMLDWDKEPGARGIDGLPSPGALPDFLILLNPVDEPSTNFRKSIETFDRP
jgi:hypothetical protein